MTVGELFETEAPPKLATRAALDVKLAGLQASLNTLVECYGSVLDVVSQCRALLAVDDDDDPAEGDASLEQAAPAESADEVSHGI
jgi:hypothetical protein